MGECVYLKNVHKQVGLAFDRYVDVILEDREFSITEKSIIRVILNLLKAEVNDILAGELIKCLDEVKGEGSG